MSRTLWFYSQACDYELGVEEVMSWYGPQCRGKVSPEMKMLDPEILLVYVSSTDVA